MPQSAIGYAALGPGAGPGRESAYPASADRRAQRGVAERRLWCLRASPAGTTAS
jgi:hypothetical protein